jgi:N-acetylated-alpha-linked acidic dipeptidase
MPVLVSALMFAAEPPAADLELGLLSVPDTDQLRQWHDQLASRPHVAGTAGDEAVIAAILDAFGQMGLDEVSRHDFHAWLPSPVSGKVEIVSPVSRDLPVREGVLPEDPDSGHDELTIGWNAYSATGDVVGEVVYANYGTRDDFARLRDLGIEVAGRVVIARYGRNFRGFKARFAEQAGAAGLIIYTDPEDSGYRKGIPYPEGGYANDDSIQRGSIKTLPYPGDPLTPFQPADRDATRRDPDQVGLPEIPVQPIGWGAASEILSRMRGPAVPSGWQGGLPFAYRLTGGPSLRVRVAVEQQATLRKTANVIGVLKGATDPTRVVVVGCHHDAWGFGAADPTSGTIVLMEVARSFAEMAAAGLRPARTIIFAAWGAEEPGIIGSVEWCETHADRLRADAVAYINLDMAAMGPRFSASAAPSLKRVIVDAARIVPQAGGTPGETVYDRWSSGGITDGLPPFGNLGGGSDHIGFYCHLGIPSCGLGGGGSPGTSYHSNYDTLTWYRQVVGDDYESALMLTRLTDVLVARLSNAAWLPFDPAQYAADLRRHLADLRTRAEAIGATADLAGLERAIDDLDTVATALRTGLNRHAGRLDADTTAALNAELIAVEREWLDETGLPERPWFRNLYAGSDPDCGYAAWMLPGLRYSVEKGDPTGLAAAEQRYVEAVVAVTDRLRGIQSLLP